MIRNRSRTAKSKRIWPSNLYQSWRKYCRETFFRQKKLWQWLFLRVFLQSPRKWEILCWIPFFVNRVLYSDIQSPTANRQSQWKGQAPRSKEIQRCRMNLLENFPIWKYNHQRDSDNRSKKACKRCVNWLKGASQRWIDSCHILKKTTHQKSSQTRNLIKPFQTG